MCTDQAILRMARYRKGKKTRCRHKFIRCWRHKCRGKKKQRNFNIFHFSVNQWALIERGTTHYKWDEQNEVTLHLIQIQQCNLHFIRHSSGRIKIILISLNNSLQSWYRVQKKKHGTRTQFIRKLCSRSQPVLIIFCKYQRQFSNQIVVFAVNRGKF